MKLFKTDTRLHKVLSILLLPFMAIASGIALVGYLCTMFLTIMVIQSVGLIMGVYSLLKWIYEATIRLVISEPNPARMR